MLPFFRREQYRKRTNLSTFHIQEGSAFCCKLLAAQGWLFQSKWNPESSLSVFFIFLRKLNRGSERWIHNLDKSLLFYWNCFKLRNTLADCFSRSLYQKFVILEKSLPYQLTGKKIQIQKWSSKAQIFLFFSYEPQTALIFSRVRNSLKRLCVF